MTDPIDRYLQGARDQGTRDRGALTPAERADAEALERAIDETRAFVAARPAPDLTAAVMRRVTECPLKMTPDPIFRRVADTLWTPRRIAFHFRPAYGLLAAAALAVLVLLPSGVLGSRAGGGPPPAEAQLFVQFRLQVADATDVRIAGSFTDWQPHHELHEAAPGIWTITLPLPRGVHDYAFVVDGEHWMPDPYAQQVNDGFGGLNSRIAILTPESPRS